MNTTSFYFSKISMDFVFGTIAVSLEGNKDFKCR